MYSLPPHRRRVKLTLVSVLFVTFVLLGPLTQWATALHCSSCDPLGCSAVMDCVGGMTLDPCNCCEECARVVNETCGGRYGVEGRCDDGLVCVISPAIGSGITDDAIGICKVIPMYPPEPSCNDAVCDVSVTSACPSDSVLTVGQLNPNGCCPDPPTCRCKPCPTGNLLLCETGYVHLLKVEGSFQPGNCCDTFECIDHAQFCDHVVCDDTSLFNATCPDDSHPVLSSSSSQETCCPSMQSCECKSKSECITFECPDGLQKRIRTLSIGNPGSCCDQFDCINGSNLVCVHNGVIRSDGDIWTLDECTTCTCREGLTFCEPAKCPALSRCSWIGTTDGECCPVCKGCVSPIGEFHLSGTSWQQDNCVSCQCEDGQIYCLAQFCAIRCSNARIVPGECCPECDEDSSSVTLASHCPLLPDCTLMCTDGYVKGKDGCYQCKCDQIPEEPCDLECPDGYRLDLLGIEVCDCAEPLLFLPTTRVSTQATDDDDPTQLSTLDETTHLDSSPISSPVPTSSSSLLPVTCPPLIGCTKQCLYGYRTDGTGCSRCRCSKCPPFECTKKCINGFLYNSEGCRLCKCLDLGSAEMTTRLPSQVDIRQCISSDGQRMDEGQAWWDGCRKCFCHQSHEMCALVACPLLRCSNPVMRPGSCCPSCGGEVTLPISPGTTSTCHSTDGRYFVEGETWQWDDCTQCICHQGATLCTIDSCPPILCHQPVILPHSCCPVCPDKDGFLPQVTWKNLQRPCRSTGGTRYSSGDSWQVNACQSCTCRDSQIHCFSQTCPILQCNKTFLKKNQCCPMCLDSSSKYCTYGSDIYSVSETWLVDECTRCLCNSEGQVLCMIAICDTPKCASPARPFGACCSVCPNITDIYGLQTMDDSLVGTNVTDETGEVEPNVFFDRTLIILVVVVVFLILVIVMLLVLLLYCKARKDRVVFNNISKPTGSSFLYVTDVCATKSCAKSTNLDYKVANPVSTSSAGTASLKLSSESLNKTRVLPTATSVSDAKPSDSDESLLENSFQLDCLPSYDDSKKLHDHESSQTPTNFNVNVHYTAMDRPRIKHNNRRSAGDELEQTRHLLTATPSLGVTNNNRKSW